MLENGYHWTINGQRSYFATFTYSDDHVPVTVEGIQTLDKKAFRKWLRGQLRISAFRYYAVGEYGDKTKRPHYHMALFCQNDEQADSILRSWQQRYGFTQVSEMHDEKARYLANYTAKKLTKADDARLEPGQEPEFRISSRNPPLGAAFIDVLVETYSKGHGKRLVEERGDIDRTFKWNGRKYPIHPWRS